AGVMSAEAALLASLADPDAFAALERALTGSGPPVASTGLAGTARAAVLALAAARTGRRVVLVVPDDAALAQWQRDLAALAPLAGLDPRVVTPLPALDADPYDDIPPHPEVARERVRALGRLARSEAGWLLVPARALLAWLPSPQEIRAASRVVR